VEPVVLEGNPTDEIVNFAEKNEITIQPLKTFN
jgi:hypothetical protein